MVFSSASFPPDSQVLLELVAVPWVPVSPATAALLAAGEEDLALEERDERDVRSDAAEAGEAEAERGLPLPLS
jgi:hypothetical protein